MQGVWPALKVTKKKPFNKGEKVVEVTGLNILGNTIHTCLRLDKANTPLPAAEWIYEYIQYSICLFVCCWKLCGR